MKKEDWDKLCRNIYEQKCILLLGSEFPIEMIENDQPTTFARLLSEKLKQEIKDFDRIPSSLTDLESRELSQLACDYINFKQTDKKLSRDDMEYMITEYLSEIQASIKSDSFTRLSDLPFSFIVDTNFTNFFFNQLCNADKQPQNAYYNFRGDKVDLINTTTSDGLGTKSQPFIYNLFGSIEDASSIVLSENDLVQFVINIISKNPGLPANVKSELANQEKSFLFLGFGFLAKNWYFRIFLQALESNNKGRMSYALECIDNIANDEDPAVLFFRDELKVSLYRYDQKTFVESLANNYAAYIEKKKLSNPEKMNAENAPKAFLSYKREDFSTVSAVCQQLKQLGINVWMDKNDLQGKWEPSIANGIAQADAFILIQSQALKNSPVNYVNVEIKEALERSRYYLSESDFIFPSFIDSDTSILFDYPSLAAINSYDLTRVDKIEQLAKDIKRSYERNKRKRAA